MRTSTAPLEAVGCDSESESALEFLRLHVKKTLEFQQQLKDFLPAIQQHDIQLSVKLSTSGNVTHLAYSYANFSFDSSDLGPQYTWDGLIKNFGMIYNPVTDFILLQSIKDKSKRKSPLPDESSTAIHQIIERLEEEENKKQVTKSERRLISALDKIKSSEIKNLRSELDLFDDFVKSIKTDTRARVITSEKVEEKHPDLDPIKQRSTKPNNYNLDEIEILLEKLNDRSKDIIIHSHQAVQDVDAATYRLKRSTVWIALIAAIFTSILSATMASIWTKHNIEASIQVTQKELAHKVNESEKNIIEYMEQRSENDPLRRYFEKIMNKL